MYEFRTFEIDRLGWTPTFATHAQEVDMINSPNHYNQFSRKVIDTMNELIIKWAVERGLDKPENATKQLTKAMEELGELSAGINKQDRDKQIDSLGDLQVVLIILAKQLGIDYIGSLESAYEVIKNRTGKTINGVFVKSEDM
jgi:NTP pyrophosphatase (non-canonical NTP hydrolase)